MSLGCFECKKNGAFNTVIIFESPGAFDRKKSVCDYSNFYVCHSCGAFGSFGEVKKSRFMIVLEKDYQESIFSISPKLQETEFKLIGEAELKKRCPNIFKALGG